MLLLFFSAKINNIEKYSLTTSNIPNIIWAYWDGEPSNCVIKCIESWKKYNPTYQINILNSNNLSSYLPEIDILNLKHAEHVQRISDYVRVCVLYKFGGFWVDASLLMTRNLDWIHDIQNNGNYEFIGYYIEAFTTLPQYPMIENWFFAAPKDSWFIKTWTITFLATNEYDSIDDYTKKLRDLGVDFQELTGINYHAEHCAAQYILQKLMTQDQIKQKLYLMKAEDGPFKYVYSHKWNRPKAILDVCNGNNITPLMKFTANERHAIDDDPKLQCIFDIVK